MATFGYANLPVPGGGDAPLAPGDLAELATAIDPHLWQHANDQADRDTKYFGAPAMTVVVALDGTTWVKISSVSNTWITLWEPLQDWQPLTPVSGMEAGSPTPRGRLDRGQAFLRGRFQLTSGAPIGISGVMLGTVPDELVPQELSSYAGGASLTGDPITGVGRVEITSEDTGSSFGPGAIVWYSQDGSGVPWVDVSGSYWLD